MCNKIDYLQIIYNSGFGISVGPSFLITFKVSLLGFTVSEGISSLIGIWSTFTLGLSGFACFSTGFAVGVSVVAFPCEALDGDAGFVSVFCATFGFAFASCGGLVGAAVTFFSIGFGVVVLTVSTGLVVGLGVVRGSGVAGFGVSFFSCAFGGAGFGVATLTGSGVGLGVGGVGLGVSTFCTFGLTSAGFGVGFAVSAGLGCAFGVSVVGFSIFS